MKRYEKKFKESHSDILEECIFQESDYTAIINTILKIVAYDTKTKLKKLKNGLKIDNFILDTYQRPYDFSGRELYLYVVGDVNGNDFDLSIQKWGILPKFFKYKKFQFIKNLESTDKNIPPRDITKITYKMII